MAAVAVMNSVKRKNPRSKMVVQVWVSWYISYENLILNKAKRLMYESF